MNAPIAKFFPISEPIPFEGKDSKKPLAFRWYDPDAKVLGKRMEDHLRFAICYWHSFCWQGNDPFGGPSFVRPWFGDADPMQMAKMKADFECTCEGEAPPGA